MKKAALWFGVFSLVLLGVAMVFSALTVHQFYTPLTEPLVLAHDPKIRQIFEEEQRHREREEYWIEFQYLTMATLEFAVAAFLAGKARRG